MTRVALATLATLALGGCAVAAGSSRIGQWRARRAVDSTACLQTPDGRCARTVVIGRDLPARSFGGGLFAFGSSGYGQRRRGDAVTHGAVIDGYYEYFRGRGRLALGGRVGASVGVGFGDRLLFTVPVSVVGYAGGAWGAAYLGVGYSPVATETDTSGGPDVPAPPATWHHDSVHALLGTRVMLRETYAQAIDVNPELRAQRLGGSTVISLTANFGLHF